VKAIIIDQYVHAMWEEEPGAGYEILCGYEHAVPQLLKGATKLLVPFDQALGLKCSRCTKIIEEARADAHSPDQSPSATRDTSTSTSKSDSG
jgi:hypothetical protein